MIQNSPFFCMKKYFEIIKMSLKESLGFKEDILYSIISNVIHIFVSCFFWNAVYSARNGENALINGMSLNDMMVYVAMCSAIACVLDSGITWNIAMNVQTGQIIFDLVKPMSYYRFKLCCVIGRALVSFFVNLLPAYLILIVVFGTDIILNFRFIIFLFSVFLAIFISFDIDMIVGIFAIYTESVWGLNLAKEVIVSFCAGALIPYSFMIDNVAKILRYTPFSAIYNIPLNILLHDDLGENFYYLLEQLLWLIIINYICRFLLKRKLSDMPLNGG